MSILDTFFILFESDASKLDKGLEHSEKGAAGLLTKLKSLDVEGAKVGTQFVSLAKQGAALLGVGVGFAAFVAGVKSVGESYNTLGKLAAQFRSTTDAVDDFLDVAQFSGLSEDAGVAALKSLDAALQDTALGMGRAGKVFDEIGIKATDAAGKVRPTTEVMAELGEVFKEFDTGKRIRIAERLGLDPALLKIFAADTADLQRRLTMIDKANGFDMDRAVKRAQEYTKAQKALGIEVKTATKFLSDMGERFQLAALPWFTKALELATRYLRVFTEYFIKHGDFIEGIVVGIGGALTYLLLPALIKSAIASALFLAPYIIMGTVIAGLIGLFALLYDDVSNFIAGNDSAIGQLLEAFPAIGEAAKAVWEFMKRMWDGIRKDGIEAFELILAAVTAVVDAIKSAFSWAGRAAGMVGRALGASSEGMSASAQEGVMAGRSALAMAGATPLASMTTGSIANRTANVNNTASVGSVVIQTQATDAAGISREVGRTMGQQIRQAASNFDDGVAR